MDGVVGGVRVMEMGVCAVPIRYDDHDHVVRCRGRRRIHAHDDDGHVRWRCRGVVEVVVVAAVA